MKKVFLFIFMFATMSFTAYGSDSNSKSQSVDALPEEMQEFVYDLRSMIIYKLDSKETRFLDIVVEGKNLVCRFKFDEDETGISLKDGLNRGLSEDDIRSEFIRRVNKKCENTVDALQKYKYDLLVRFTGSKSKYVRDIKICYREF